MKNRVWLEDQVVPEEVRVGDVHLSYGTYEHSSTCIHIAVPDSNWPHGWRWDLLAARGVDGDAFVYNMAAAQKKIEEARVD